MTSDPRDPGPLGDDDLFDLPAESVAASGLDRAAPAKTSAEVEIPPAALPRRADRTGPAGPPMPNVPSTVDAILQEVRKRPAKTEAAPIESAAVPPVSPSLRVPRSVWIALGALVLINLAVLTFLVLRPDSSGSTQHGEVEATALSSLKVDATPDRAPTAVAPEPASTPRLEPVLSDASSVERARQVLADARKDVADGRRGSARVRLGRLGLTIDAIEPASRESIRAEIALLLAESMQADADAASGAKR